MEVLEYVFGSLLILCSIVLVLLVMFQEQKGRGLSGAIGGDMGGMAGGRNRGMDAVLAKYTKIVGIVFFVLVVAMGVVGLLK